MPVGAVRPIVVGFDGTPESQLALRWATEEAVLRALPVRLVGVHERPPVTPEITPEPNTDPIPPPREAADRVFDDALAYVSDRIGADAVTGVRHSGRAAQLLVAESRTAGLLVVGSRSRAAFASVVLGSVSSAVAAHANCPVVLVRIGRTGPGAKRVVVGVDGSAESEQALAFGFEAAALRRVPLEIVHCWQPVEPDDPAIGFVRHTRERRDRRRWLKQLARPYELEHPNVGVTTELVEGRPAALLAVRSWSAQLIVVGSRGHGGLVGLVLGSVSQSLLHHAHCSVAVLRGSTAT